MEGTERNGTAGSRDHVYLCVFIVCVPRACRVTKQEFMRGHGGKREKGGGGGCCAFSGPAGPYLLPSVESISDCIMLWQTGTE